MDYKKVNKPTARKLFNGGKEVYLLPNKANPIVLDPNYKGMYEPVVITKKGDEDNQFDRLVNSFEYYNCNNEVGYYAHYYIKINKEGNQYEVK